MENRAISVKQLNLYVKSLLEGDVRLQRVTVTGELSNFKNHYGSGHYYFTLKDKDAAIKCVMFRSYASKVNFRAEDGVKVVITGRVSLYEKDGQYQFYAEEMLEVGSGELARQFEEIKARLLAEGLLDAKNKRPLPRFPKKIAVITSPTGAAIQDIFNILNRRWPVCQVLMCPVSVQGASAVQEMLLALDKVYETENIDLIIIGRGGGSAEDLQAFNSEELARKIYESPVPVISAVGHETDFSISDFVADLRAPTPSAAAEIAVPDCSEILLRLSKLEAALKSNLQNKYNFSLAKYNNFANIINLRRGEELIINNRLLEIDRIHDRLVLATNNAFVDADTRFKTIVASLQQLSPLKILTRGYSSVSKDGSSISSVSKLEIGDKIDVRFSDGVTTCTVDERMKFDEQ